MRLSCFCLYLFVCMFSASGQQDLTDIRAQMNDFNSFQDFLYKSKNVDSAVKCLQRMGDRKGLEQTLIDLIDMSFSQSFQYPDQQEKDTAVLHRTQRQRKLSLAILSKVRADEVNSKPVIKILQPLVLVIDAQEAEGNPDKLRSVADRFAVAEKGVKYPDDVRYARYGFQLLAILSRYHLKDQFAALQDKMHEKLRNNQIGMTDTSTRMQLDQRARLRYLYAYSNYMKAQETTVPSAKETLLKTAFDFSPDLADKNHSGAYFYDMIALFGTEKESFKIDYINYITSQQTKSAQLLPVLLDLALVEPTYKDTLEAYYLREGNSTSSFKSYWSKAIVRNARTAPPISLMMKDSKKFSSQDKKGEWIVVDFWGTWCGPCREEHPRLQEFYDSVIKRNSDRISLITIACRDNAGSVEKYMNSKAYSFPVAMSDNKIENAFNVQGYPTKMLITPEGKAILIPFNSDFETFIRKYAGL